MSNPFRKENEFFTNLFIGRKREIWGIWDRLANPHSRVSSAIYGEPGSGKSWFLERLKQPDSLAEWEIEEPKATLISLNCREINPWTPKAFWQTIFQQFYTKAIPSSEQEIITELLDTNSSDTFLIGQLLDRIVKNDRFFILLLDNFEWVIDNTDFENPAFLNVLRSLLVREKKGLGIVLTTTAKPLHELCKPIPFIVSPFDNVFYPVELKPFNSEEVDNFIKVHLINTPISFSEDEKQSLFEASWGHPGQLREVCYQLFEHKTR